jgi:uncharacterized protein (DUF433 family)
LTIDLAPFLKSVRQKLAELGEARALVVEDPEVLSGTPVIRNTRVPVYDGAASVAAGLPMTRILTAYPGLTAEMANLAARSMQRPTRHGAGRENIHLRPPELSSSRPDAHLVESELMKLLVDECLSEELTKLAQRRGHAEATHIAWIGKRGWKDWH